MTNPDPGDVALKVMRISRPVLHEETPIYSDDAEETDLGNHSGLGDALLVPNSVGDFYLGEPANFMVTVQNLSTSQVALDGVRVLIQTESRHVPRTTVHESQRSSPLGPGELETIYFKIDCRHPEEIAMLCDVAYQRGGVELNFKRKYLLPVKTPFELGWDYSVLGRGRNLLKMSVTNKVDKRIVFEECTLAGSGLKIDTIYETQRGTMLPTNGTHTKSVMIESEGGVEFAAVQMSLDLKWRSEAGNRGHIQYSQIRPRTNAKAEIDVRIAPCGELPVKRFLSMPVCVTVRNNTERNVDLVVELDPSGDIQWDGVAAQTVGPLAPHSERSLDMSIVPLIRGTHPIPGLSFTDTLLGATYQFSSLYHLQVE